MANGHADLGSPFLTLTQVANADGVCVDAGFCRGLPFHFFVHTGLLSGRRPARSATVLLPAVTSIMHARMLRTLPYRHSHSALSTRWGVLPWPTDGGPNSIPRALPPPAAAGEVTTLR